MATKETLETWVNPHKVSISRGQNSLLKDRLGLASCLLECFLFPGAISGWASIVFIWKGDGVYNHLCPFYLHDSSNDSDILQLGSILSPNESALGSQRSSDMEDVFNRTFLVPHSNVSLLTSRNSSYLCDGQDEMISLAFTVGMATFGIGLFPIGWLFDQYGLRLTRLLGCAFGVLAYLCLAFTGGEEFSWLIFPGTTLLGINCSTGILTNMHVARLAKSKTSTVMAIYSGLLNMCALFLLVKVLYENGIPRVASLAFICGLWSIVLFSTVFLLPEYKVADDGTHMKKGGELKVPLKTWQQNEQGLKENKDYHEGDTNRPTGSKQDASVKPQVNAGSRPGILSSIFSLRYILFLYWFCANHLSVQMMVNTYNVWISQVVHEDRDKVSFYVDVYGYTYFFALVTAPISGVITDKLRAQLSGKMKKPVLASVPALCISSILACLLSFSLLLYKEPVIYVSSILVTLTKSFLYSSTPAFINLAFPADQFGRLYGLQYAVAGCATWIMYAYVKWANSNPLGLIPVDALLAATNLLSFTLPLSLLDLPTPWAKVASRPGKKNHKENKENYKHVPITKQRHNMDNIRTATACPDRNIIRETSL